MEYFELLFDPWNLRALERIRKEEQMQAANTRRVQTDGEA